MSVLTPSGLSSLLPSVVPHRLAKAAQKAKHLDRENGTLKEPDTHEVDCDPPVQLLDTTREGINKSIEELKVDFESQQEVTEAFFEDPNLDKEYAELENDR